jgi:uncharacterized membrane protein
MAGFLLIGDYIFAYAYPISFIGSMFYGIVSIMYVNPASAIANNNTTILVNILIGLCGLLSLFNWYQNNQVPVIGPIVLADGPQNIIKTQA